MRNFIIKAANESVQLILCLFIIFNIQFNTCEKITSSTPGAQMFPDSEPNSFSIQSYHDNNKLHKYSSTLHSKLYWNAPLTHRLRIKNQYFKGQNSKQTQPYMFSFASPYFPLRTTMRGVRNNRAKKSFGALTRLYSHYLGMGEKSKETKAPANSHSNNSPVSIVRIGRHFFSPENPFERFQNSGEYNSYRRPLAMRLRWG